MKIFFPFLYCFFLSLTVLSQSNLIYQDSIYQSLMAGMSGSIDSTAFNIKTFPNISDSVMENAKGKLHMDNFSNPVDTFIITASKAVSDSNKNEIDSAPLNNLSNSFKTVNNLQVSSDSIKKDFNKSTPGIPKSDVALVVAVNNFSELDSLFVKFGMGPGTGNLLDLKLSCKIIGGKNYLISDNTQYEVVNGLVTFNFQAPEVLLQRNFLSVRGKKKDGSPTLDYIKRYN